MSDPAGLQSTKLSRNWLLKLGIFLVVLLVLGTWGFVDATVIYPRNGLEDASFKLKNYLQAAADTNRLSVASVRVENPEEELTRLAAREALQQQSKDLKSVKEPLTDLEAARLAWLRSLDRVWKLGDAEISVGKALRTRTGPGGTEIYSGVGGTIDAQKDVHQVRFSPRKGTGASIGPDGKRSELAPESVLKDLKEYWGQTKKTPSALEFYDLPSQWVFVVVGYVGAVYIVFLLVRAGTKKYQFDPKEKRLILPGGVSIVPADLKDLDKRKWHKFFVTLHLKDGKSCTLDLLRYVPLEDWVIRLEKAAFPEAATPEEQGGDEATGPDGTANAVAVPKDVGKVSNMTYGGVFEGVFAVLLFDPSKDPGQADYAAVAQGETLKALGAALVPEGGWNLWLTACQGLLGGAAQVGGGPSLGVRNLSEWLSGKGFGYQVDGSRLDVATAAQIRARGAGGEPMQVTPYVLAIGRISSETAAKLHETMMDPPMAGYLGLLVVKSSPATIERISEPLEIEAGLEIKANACRGMWKVPAEEIDAAGLMPEEPAGA